MTSSTSFSGYDSSGNLKTIYLHKSDTQVERTLSNDAIFVTIPTDSESDGQYGYDILYITDTFTVTGVIKPNAINMNGATPYTAQELYLLLFEICKVDDEPKSFTFQGVTYSTIVTRLDVTWSPGKKDQFDLNMAMTVVKS